jgi:hypothetical protein
MENMGVHCGSVSRELGKEVREEETDGWGPSVSEREEEGGGLGWLTPGRPSAACFLSFFCSETFPIFCFSVLCCLQKQTRLKRETSNSENF